jgi:hypothetical protein
LHHLHDGLVLAAPELGVVGCLSTALACPLFDLPFRFFYFFLLVTALTFLLSSLPSPSSLTSLMYLFLDFSGVGFGSPG